MKPVFIYKYERDMQKKSKEFFNLFMKQGDAIEKDFLQETIIQNQATGDYDKEEKMSNAFRRKKSIIFRKPINVDDDAASAISKTMKRIRVKKTESRTDVDGDVEAPQEFNNDE